MKGLAAIYGREMRAYFTSPIAYVLLVGLAVITGYLFYNITFSYAQISMQAVNNPMAPKMNITVMVVGAIMQITALWVFTFMCPLLTMRLISEEKRSGTLELLLSYPVTDAAVVLGKFLASWTILLLLLTPTMLQVIMLGILGQVHLPSVILNYLGVLLLGGAFLSLGILTSALTENQIVAAVAGFGAILILWLIGWAESVAGPVFGPILKAIGVGSHYETFAKGILDTADLAYYLLFMAWFLFVTIRTLEAKRWKG